MPYNLQVTELSGWQRGQITKDEYHDAEWAVQRLTSKGHKGEAFVDCDT